SVMETGLMSVAGGGAPAPVSSVLSAKVLFRLRYAAARSAFRGPALRPGAARGHWLEGECCQGLK
ncbi:hypothetical protein, partial [Klebsiella pneumoniae]|uniref:hypothetical protein n=1 Tax=Klebsiella pneumoniae TaxID=573 RepID=UPI001954B97C